MFLIIAFLFNNFIICHSLDTNIGNYSQYIKDYKLCGQSRISIPERTDCFKYHGKFNLDVKGGREVHLGEAPWIVKVNLRNSYMWGLFTGTKGGCGGALISDEWVLTAAHCQSDRYRIYFGIYNEMGDYIGGTKFIPHSQYIDGDYGYYDIALIKLETPIKINYSSNFICLPNKNYSYSNAKFAMVAGFGPGNNRLQIGPIKTVISGPPGLRFLTSHASFRTEMCQGDSGTGIWMYDMGRAYLIGIATSSDFKIGNQCAFISYAAFVPEHIDWILEIIKTN